MGGLFRCSFAELRSRTSWPFVCIYFCVIFRSSNMPKNTRERSEQLKSVAPSLPPRGPLVFRHALLSLAFALLYFLLNEPGVIFVSHLGWSAWYPAIGLVLALLMGIHPWYALLAALADMFTAALSYHRPIWSIGGTIGAVLVAACYGGAAYVLRGPLKVDLSLRRGRDVICYVCVSLCAALGATASGVLCLIADHSIPVSEAWTSAAAWFIGDGVGLLGFAPFLLIHVFPPVRRWLSHDASPAPADGRASTTSSGDGDVIEAVAQAACVLAVLWMMFSPHWAHLQLFYISFIPILWVAMRSGIRRVVVGNLVLDFGIVFFMHMFPPDPALLAKIGPLMLVVSGAGLIVGATVTERQYLAATLNERTTYLNSLFENSPLGIVVLQRNGLIELANDAFTELSLFQRDDLIGRDLDSVFPSDPTVESSRPWVAEVLRGRAQHWTARRSRKDGTPVDLELHAVPLVIGNTVRGAYAICKDISEHVNASQAQRAHAKSLNLLVRELETQTNQMSMLNEMARLLECCATIKEACAVVGQSLPRFFPEGASGALYTFKASRNLVEATAWWGSSSLAPDPVFAPQDCWALRRGQPHISNNGEQGIVCPHLQQLPEARYICLPMVGQGETLGVIQLEFPRKGELDESLQSQMRLGVTVASQIALSLASLRLRENLRDQSIRDSLTGLFNRRFMQESLEREMMRARRKNNSLSLLFLDIDHFKRFNDTFGHDAGDFVLQSVADVLRNYFRGDDVACRCGGEEFAIILPESRGDDAALRAEGLREELRSLKLQHRDIRLGPISVSIGVAAFPEDCSTPDELLKIADQCLYQSKTAGRDRVTLANDAMAASKTPDAKISELA